MAIRFSLFGAPTVESGGESIALQLERRSQLLVWLALQRHWVGRAELAALLWPGVETRLAYANLRKTIFRLQSLPWAAALEAERGALRFIVDTDVFDFESALRGGRLADSLGLRRGELLAGFDDDANEAWSGWLGFERNRLRAAWRGAAIERLGGELDPGIAIELSARLLEADPLDEAALRLHMGWLARDGQSALAREAYRAFAGRLSADLGLQPGAELEALHDSLRNVASASVPAQVAEPDDGFVGRVVELRRLSELLASDEGRLVGLVGPGGVGKSRLARHAMQQAAAQFADGAVFVALDDISAPAEFGSRVAREIGATLSGSDDALGQVVAFLRERRMLLVLDNFEQLALDAPMLLARLLDGCPQLKLIVTSRVRLPLPAARWLAVEGLPCPEAEDGDRIEAFDAARLFVRAAQRVDPAMSALAEPAAIVEICRQVEGLPLALELAAAWTRVLSCAAIAAELRQGLELLRATDPTQPARHASIELVFEQSWRRLSDVERDALARLSVFRGGFSVEAARQVTGASLPVFGALADKSLLRKEADRLSLQPLVQQMAATRLGDEQAAAAQLAHLRHFQRLLAHLRSAVENGQRDALQEIDIEFENCRLAWRWAVDRGAADAMLQLVPTLFYFCDHRGRFEEGALLIAAGLDAAASSSDLRLKAMLLGQVAHLRYRMDRYPEAAALAERSLAAARLARDSGTQAQAHQVLGACALRLGEHEDAVRHFKQATQHALAAGDQRRAAAAQHNQAVVTRRMGHRDEALRQFMELLARHKSLGDIAGEALCLINLALLNEEVLEFESAVTQLKMALAICDRHGFVSWRAMCLANLTGLSVKQRDEAAAYDYGARSLELAAASGNRAIASAVKLRFAELAIRRGELTQARRELVEALTLASAIGQLSLLLECVSCFGDLLAAQREFDAARQVQAFAAGHPAMSVPIRNEILSRVAGWPASASTEPPGWPGIGLDELVQRIVLESDLAHAPLIAALRGVPKASAGQRPAGG